MSNRYVALIPAKQIGWIIAGLLALILLWVTQLYRTAQSEKTILLQQQELTTITLKGITHQLEAERILSKYQLQVAESKIEDLEREDKNLNAPID